MNLTDLTPDWYSKTEPGAQICPKCEGEDDKHCDGFVDFCECDCVDY